MSIETKAKTETFPLDIADLIPEPESQVAFLNDALADPDPRALPQALGIVARAKGVAQVAEEAGVTRQALYKSFEGAADMKLSTLRGILRSLGLDLSVVRSAE